MATYKVIQDIEAEDKFVGPLTLKQFIFASAGVAFGWLSVLALTKGAAWALAIFLPPMFLGFFLAIPWSKEQPTEVWVLAKLRFRIKPKTRIWNQDGLQELVTITVPKKIEKQLTDNLSQTEVKSRLKALADTIDTRGWAVKNAQVNVAMTEETSDRLISPTILPKQVPSLDASVPDMMDDDTPVSANFDQMIHTSGQLHKENNMEKMDRIRRGEPLEAANQPQIIFSPPAPKAPTIMPPVNTAVDEATLAQQLRERRENSSSVYSHHRINTRDQSAAKHPKQTDTTKAKAEMTTSATPAIIQGFSQNNDLTIDTVAREVARETKKAAKTSDGEVVINLH